MTWSRAASIGGKRLLMVVNVLAETMPPRRDDRDHAGVPGLGDGGRATMADDDARAADEPEQLAVGQVGHGLGVDRARWPPRAG